VGESLIKAKFGLPNIKGQASVDVVYEQAEKQGFGTGSSAKLIDPTHMLIHLMQVDGFLGGSSSS
jgi:hypothetical protein